MGISMLYSVFHSQCVAQTKNISAIQQTQAYEYKRDELTRHQLGQRLHVIDLFLLLLLYIRGTYLRQPRVWQKTWLEKPTSYIS